MAQTAQERLEDIKEYPEKHRHTFGELQECAMLEGAIDLRLIDAHAQYAPVGECNGKPCDVTDGECSCGHSH